MRASELSQMQPASSSEFLVTAPAPFPCVLSHVTATSVLAPPSPPPSVFAAAACRPRASTRNCCRNVGHDRTAQKSAVMQFNELHCFRAKARPHYTYMQQSSLPSSTAPLLPPLSILATVASVTIVLLLQLATLALQVTRCVTMPFALLYVPAPTAFRLLPLTCPASSADTPTRRPSCDTAATAC